jgi:hypothetical protein
LTTVQFQPRGIQPYISGPRGAALLPAHVLQRFLETVQNTVHNTQIRIEAHDANSPHLKKTFSTIRVDVQLTLDALFLILTSVLFSQSVNCLYFTKFDIDINTLPAVGPSPPDISTK